MVRNSLELVAAIRVGDSQCHQIIPRRPKKKKKNWPAKTQKMKLTVSLKWTLVIKQYYKGQKNWVKGVNSAIWSLDEMGRNCVWRQFNAEHELQSALIMGINVERNPGVIKLRRGKVRDPNPSVGEFLLALVTLKFGPCRFNLASQASPIII
jgi:hypothetical protein